MCVGQAQSPAVRIAAEVVYKTCWRAEHDGALQTVE